MSVFHIFYVPLFAYTHDPWRWVAHWGGVDMLYRSFSVGMYAQIGQMPLRGSFVEAASIYSTYHLLRRSGITKPPFRPHSFSHFTASHFTPFQRIPKEKMDWIIKQNTFKKKKKACPKKLRECLALCTQLPPAPSSSSIFLSIPSSWCFLISPQCLGIAVFLEANLSRALQMPLWVWIPEGRCLSSSTTCILLVFLGKLLTLKQTRTCLLTFPSGSSHRSTWLLR